MKIKIAFAFALTSLISFYAISQKGDKLVGTWVGKFKFNSGSEFLMQLSISEANKDEFSGIALWPDYFNSGSYIEGKITKKGIEFNEVSIFQGIAMDISSIYKMELDGGKLIGTSSPPGKKPVANFELTSFESLPKEKQNTWKGQLSEYKDKFGEAIVLEEIELDEALQLYNQYNKANELFLSLNNIEMWGNSSINGLLLPTYGAFKNQKFFLKMTIENKSFLLGKNDSIEWTYNAATDETSITRKEGDDNSSSFFKNNEHDSEIIKANRSKFNGISSIRLVMENEQDEKTVIFISNEQELLRSEENNELMDYSEYKVIEGIKFPTYFHQLKTNQDFSIKIDSAAFNTHIDEGIFELSQELRSKQKSKSDEDDLNRTGNSYFEKGDYETAIEFYSNAIQKNGYRFIFYHNRGFAYLKLEKYYEAITDLGRSIELNENYADSWHRRGLAKYSLGDYKNAMLDFKQAASLDSLHDDAILYEGLSAYNLEHYDKAIDLFKLLSDRDSTNGLYAYNLGYTYYQLEESDSLAIQYFQRSIRNNYKNAADAYNYLGIVQYRNNLYDDAIVSFSGAIDSNNKNSVFHLNLGKSYYQTGDLKNAVKYIEKSLKIEPDNDDAENYLGLSYYQDEDYQTAIPHFTRAIEINPENAVYFDNRANTKAALMNFSGAIDDFTESINLYSKDAEIYYLRGMMSVNLNNHFDACKDFKKALELGHKEAEEAINENCDFMKND